MHFLVNKKFKIIIIIIILLCVFYFIRKIIFNNPKINLIPNFNNFIQYKVTNNEVGDDTSFIASTDLLRTLNIDDKFIHNKLFSYLRDNRVKLQYVKPGRPNPFAPIGGLKFKVAKKSEANNIDSYTNNTQYYFMEITPPSPQIEEVIFEDYYNYEEYEIIEEDTNTSGGSSGNDIVVNSFTFNSPTYGEIINTNNINLNFTVTGSPVLCWYDLGGLILNPNTPSTPGDPVDLEYQYPLEDCQSGIIILPNGDYILNLWVKYSDGTYDFESNSFTINAPI